MPQYFLAVVTVISMLGIPALGGYFISINLYRRLARSGRKYARLIKVGAFLVSYLLILAILVFRPSFHLPLRTMSSANRAGLG